MLKFKQALYLESKTTENFCNIPHFPQIGEIETWVDDLTKKEQQGQVITRVAEAADRIKGFEYVERF